STATLPSRADGRAALAVSVPVSAEVLASKLPPTVIGHFTLTSPWPTRHGPFAADVTAVHNETNRTTRSDVRRWYVISRSSARCWRTASQTCAAAQWPDP